MIPGTGVSGQLGKVVVQTLLKHASADQVAVLVRDESRADNLKARGVSVRIGDSSDPISLKQAMQSIDRVLLIAGTDEEHRVRLHQNVIGAARQAGVQCLASTSRTLKNRSTMTNRLMAGHFESEEYLQGSGLGYAIFRDVL
jgi:NAD(P)H dehydrogenase (quinone)